MAKSTAARSRKSPPRKAGKSPPAKARTRSAQGTGAQSAKWGDLQVDWPQPKQAISLRIDQDVLAWFRDGGPGYQTRMNAVLRAFVDAQGRR